MTQWIIGKSIYFNIFPPVFETNGDNKYDANISKKVAGTIY